MFISFEGTEGAGKSTLIRGVSQFLTQQQKKHHLTREPGGTAFAEQIRALLLTPQQSEAIALDCELLLLFAARAQHIAQVIMPAHAAGEWILCDRFVDASMAYQHGGRGIEQHRIEQLIQLFVPVIPDLTFWLDIPVEIGLARARARGPSDRFEQEQVEFFERVRLVYASLHQQSPQRIMRLDAALSSEQLLEQAIANIKSQL